MSCGGATARKSLMTTLSRHIRFRALLPRRLIPAVLLRSGSLMTEQRDKQTYDKPQVTCRDVAKLAKSFFPFVSVDEDSIVEMDSYDDRNFYIEGVVEEQDQKTKGSFTLKVTNRRESANTALLEAQNDFMLYLLEGGFAAPRPLQARGGGFIVLHSIALPNCMEGDATYAIRVFTFLQGELLVKVRQNPSLLVELGKAIGRMNIHLKDFPKHVAIDDRDYNWNLGTNLLTARKYIHAIDTKQKRQLVTEVMDAFEAYALPVLKSLPMDYIHGDLNDYNILLGKPDKLGQRHVSGILDYGDIVQSYRVVDIAIAMAYSAIGKEDGLRVASCHLLSGYQMVHPLSDKELDILYYLIVGRLCQTCVLSSFYYNLDPTNDYLLVSSNPGWESLQKIWSQPKAEVDKMFS